jgi:hypothetical protein
MKSLMYFGVAACLACAASPAPKASTAAAAPVGPGAVWTPPADFRAAFHAACDGTDPDMSACFLRQMQAAGASAAALDFSRRTGGQGYLAYFRDAGAVDVAYAEYPFRANANRVVFLVNGEPPMIDVDDPARIDPKALAANSVYAVLRKGVSNLTIFPGDRSEARFPRVLSRQGGGHSYVFPYELTDGCHACTVVGEAYVAFDFDARGRLEGTSIVRVHPRYR